jgi:hypothetical protein
MKQISHGRRWGWAACGGRILAVGVLSISAPGPVAAKQPGRGSQAGVAAILARAEQAEEQVRSGQVMLARTTENYPMSERELRELIKGPKELEVEMAIAKTMPRRVVERETIRFDNPGRQLFVQWDRKGGQVPIGRALFTPAFFKTHSELRDASPGERQNTFIDRPKWPPYSPYDRWRGRVWSGRSAAIRKGQITARRLGRDPQTGWIGLFLAGGPGAEMDQKLWVDPARGYTMPRLQAFDTKTGRLEFDERAQYRLRGGLWYPDRLIQTYYVYNAQGWQRLSRRETSIVTEARINLPLSAAAFAFPVPHGAFVQDNRVNPPLIYHEGVESPQQALRRRQEPRPVRLRVGQAAPAFELPSLSGEKLRLADLRGKVVFLNLFALW